MKLIRLEHLSNINRIKCIKDASVKIIHLLRDPRSLIASRKTGGTFLGWTKGHKLLYDDSLGQQQRLISPDFSNKHGLEAYEYCTNEMKNLKFAVKDKWISSRYLKTTHEALSSEPLEMLEVIYRFIGKPLSDSLRKEVSLMTQGKSYSHLKNPALDTNKVSKDIISKWKKMSTLMFHQLRQVEDNCGELFKKIHASYVLDKTNSQNYLSNIGVQTL